MQAIFPGSSASRGIPRNPSFSRDILRWLASWRREGNAAILTGGREHRRMRGRTRGGRVDAIASSRKLEVAMTRKFSASVGVVALSTTAIVAFPSTSSSQTPPAMGGGYTNVIAIPVDDPAIKAIAGSLIKPAGTGPFPAVVYMSGCGGIDNPADRAQQKAAIEHLQSKGVAILIVDPFTPRNEPEGVCANLNEKTFDQYASRGGNDTLAALSVLKAMPDIDTKHIFLQGYSFGAISSLFATQRNNPANHDAPIAGVIAYYPFATTASILRFLFSS